MMDDLISREDALKVCEKYNGQGTLRMTIIQKGEPMNNKLSVANDIKALALINIQDIFRFMLTATDDEITERYGSEARAIEIADKYLDIAFRVDFIQDSIKGWSMTYTQPIKDSDERREYKAYFYDTKDSKSGGEI